MVNERLETKKNRLLLGSSLKSLHERLKLVLKDRGLKIDPHFQAISKEEGQLLLIKSFEIGNPENIAFMLRGQSEALALQEPSRSKSKHRGTSNEVFSAIFGPIWNQLLGADDSPPPDGLDYQGAYSYYAAVWLRKRLDLMPTALDRTISQPIQKINATHSFPFKKWKRLISDRKVEEAFLLKSKLATSQSLAQILLIPNGHRKTRALLKYIAKNPREADMIRSQGLIGSVYDQNGFRAHSNLNQGGFLGTLFSSFSSMFSTFGSTLSSTLALLLEPATWLLALRSAILGLLGLAVISYWSLAPLLEENSGGLLAFIRRFLAFMRNAIAGTWGNWRLKTIGAEMGFINLYNPVSYFLNVIALPFQTIIFFWNLVDSLLVDNNNWWSSLFLRMSEVTSYLKAMTAGMDSTGPLSQVAWTIYYYYYYSVKVVLVTICNYLLGLSPKSATNIFLGGFAILILSKVLSLCCSGLLTLLNDVDEAGNLANLGIFGGVFRPIIFLLVNIGAVVSQTTSATVFQLSRQLSKLWNIATFLLSIASVILSKVLEGTWFVVYYNLKLAAMIAKLFIGFNMSVSSLPRWVTTSRDLTNTDYPLLAEIQKTLAADWEYMRLLAILNQSLEVLKIHPSLKTANARGYRDYVKYLVQKIRSLKITADQLVDQSLQQIEDLLKFNPWETLYYLSPSAQKGPETLKLLSREFESLIKIDYREEPKNWYDCQIELLKQGELPKLLLLPVIIFPLIANPALGIQGTVERNSLGVSHGMVKGVLGVIAIKGGINLLLDLLRLLKKGNWPVGTTRYYARMTMLVIFGHFMTKDIVTRSEMLSDSSSNRTLGQLIEAYTGFSLQDVVPVVSDVPDKFSKLLVKVLLLSLGIETLDYVATLSRNYKKMPLHQWSSEISKSISDCWLFTTLKKCVTEGALTGAYLGISSLIPVSSFLGAILSRIGYFQAVGQEFGQLAQSLELAKKLAHLQLQDVNRIAHEFSPYGLPVASKDPSYYNFASLASTPDSGLSEIGYWLASFHVPGIITRPIEASEPVVNPNNLQDHDTGQLLVSQQPSARIVPMGVNAARLMVDRRKPSAAMARVANATRGELDAVIAADPRALTRNSFLGPDRPVLQTLLNSSARSALEVSAPHLVKPPLCEVNLLCADPHMVGRGGDPFEVGVTQSNLNDHIDRQNRALFDQPRRPAAPDDDYLLLAVREKYRNLPTLSLVSKPKTDLDQLELGVEGVAPGPSRDLGEFVNLMRTSPDANTVFNSIAIVDQFLDPVRVMSEMKAGIDLKIAGTNHAMYLAAPNGHYYPKLVSLFKSLLPGHDLASYAKIRALKTKYQNLLLAFNRCKIANPSDENLLSLELYLEELKSQIDSAEKSKCVSEAANVLTSKLFTTRLPRDGSAEPIDQPAGGNEYSGAQWRNTSYNRNFLLYNDSTYDGNRLLNYEGLNLPLLCASKSEVQLGVAMNIPQYMIAQIFKVLGVFVSRLVLLQLFDLARVPLNKILALRSYGGPIASLFAPYGGASYHYYPEVFLTGMYVYSLLELFRIRPTSINCLQGSKNLANFNTFGRWSEFFEAMATRTGRLERVPVIFAGAVGIRLLLQSHLDQISHLLPVGSSPINTAIIGAHHYRFSTGDLLFLTLSGLTSFAAIIMGGSMTLSGGGTFFPILANTLLGPLLYIIQRTYSALASIFVTKSVTRFVGTGLTLLLTTELVLVLALLGIGCFDVVLPRIIEGNWARDETPESPLAAVNKSILFRNPTLTSSIVIHCAEKQSI